MQNFSPEQIENIQNIVNSSVLSSIDGINSTIGNSLNIFIAVITVTLTIVGFISFSKKKIIEEIDTNLENKFIEERRKFETITDEKINEYLKIYIKELKSQIHKEEFLRNLMTFDIYKILSTEIKLNGENNINQIFNIHSDRIFTISQLTSGNSKQIIKALKKLKNGNLAYEPIIASDNFRNYISYLEKNYNELSIKKEIFKFKEKVFL